MDLPRSHYSTTGLHDGMPPTTRTQSASTCSSLERIAQPSWSSCISPSSSAVRTTGTSKRPLAVEPRGTDGHGVSLGPSCCDAAVVTRFFSFYFLLSWSHLCRVLFLMVLLALFDTTGQFWVRREERLLSSFLFAERLTTCGSSWWETFAARSIAQCIREPLQGLNFRSYSSCLDVQGTSGIRPGYEEQHMGTFWASSGVSLHFGARVSRRNSHRRIQKAISCCARQRRPTVQASLFSCT